MSITAKYSLFAVSQTEICRTVGCSQSLPYQEDFHAMSKASNYAMSLRGHLWPWQSASLKTTVFALNFHIIETFRGNGLPRRAYALLAMTWLFGSLFLY